MLVRRASASSSSRAQSTVQPCAVKYCSMANRIDSSSSTTRMCATQALRLRKRQCFPRGSKASDVPDVNGRSTCCGCGGSERGDDFGVRRSLESGRGRLSLGDLDLELADLLVQRAARNAEALGRLGHAPVDFLEHALDVAALELPQRQAGVGAGAHWSRCGCGRRIEMEVRGAQC